MIILYSAAFVTSWGHSKETRNIINCTLVQYTGHDETGYNLSTMLDISKVTNYLYVGSRLSKEEADKLELFHFDLIISMIGQMPPDEIYTRPPFKTLWIRTYDTFLTPIPVKKLVLGVNAALHVIQNQGRVLVYCILGKHRSIAMAAAILISMGYPREQALDSLMVARKAADPRMWYIHNQIKAFERYWEKK